MGIGAFAGLMAALMWTCSSMIWGRIQLTALTLNFFKNLIGVFLITAHVAIVQLSAGEPLFLAPSSSWFWLGISGLIGIVIGDTFYFRSLQIIGPRLALMVATTAPLFSAFLTSFILKEMLSVTALTGIGLTVLGVIVVVGERKKENESPGLMPGNFKLGAIYGVLSALCQALGGVFSKKGMIDSVSGESICDPAEATLIRILVAAIGTTIAVMFSGKLKLAVKNGLKRENVVWLIPATAIGTWIGIWLSQIAYQKSNVAVAQTLLATCPLFAIPIVWWLYGKKATLVAIVGTVIAIFGVYLAMDDEFLVRSYQFLFGISKS